MNQNVNELIKARVRQWNKAAAVLQDVRNHDIQHADTARAMHCFTGAVLAALPKHPPLPWSGLVEQQKIFRKVRVLASGEWRVASGEWRVASGRLLKSLLKKLKSV